MSRYLLRAAALQGMRETVAELGSDLDQFQTNIDIARLEHEPEAWISYDSWLRLLEEIALTLNCPHFGLYLSRKQDIGLLGSVGFIIQQAPTVAAALKDLSLYFNHHNQGAMVSHIVENELTFWTFDYKPDLHAPLRQQSDLVAGIAATVMSTLSENWRPRAIYLPHSAPADTQPYQKYLQCPVYFDSDATVIVSDAKALQLPIDRANPNLRRVLQAHLEANTDHDSDDFQTRVKYLIRQALLSGGCSVERISEFLAMNKRTLQRRLSALDTSYNELLDEVRFGIACDYLKESRGSLTQLAYQLCYSELSVFSNAFRQRFGVSPRQWKNQLGSSQQLPYSM